MLEKPTPPNRCLKHYKVAGSHLVIIYQANNILLPTFNIIVKPSHFAVSDGAICLCTVVCLCLFMSVLLGSRSRR